MTVWSPAQDPPRRGGPRPARREGDGRTARTDCSRRSMAGRLLEALIDKAIFQPKFEQLGEAVGSRKGEAIARVFGARRLCLIYLARIAPARVVDAIGLTAAARAALSERDERAIAWAVLAGRKLEAGQ